MCVNKKNYQKINPDITLKNKRSDKITFRALWMPDFMFPKEPSCSLACISSLDKYLFSQTKS